MYSIQVEKSVLKQLLKIPKKEQLKIQNSINLLALDPRPKGYKKLQGSEYYRIRVGDYRIIYEIHDSVLRIIILIVAHRREVYS